MDAGSVFRDLSNGQSSIFLVRAICLVICKAKQASSFLRLTEDGPLLNHMDFASKLLDGLDAAIKADLEPDRVTKIQILTLMHLHNDGQYGVDRSSSYLSQAISEAWSLPLHHKVHGNPDQEQWDYLWWSLRNFDRLNKPIMGAAPFIIDDTDISIKRIASKRGNYRSQLMGVALVLGDLMATATRVYKASSKATVDDCHEFPSLKDLTSDTGRLSSADGVISLVSNGRHESLPPLPLVPYATSMATTVMYRALRDGVRDMHTACQDLRLCCDALDALSERWTSARGIAKLASRLWKSAKSATNHQCRDNPEPLRRAHSRQSVQSSPSWEIATASDTDQNSPRQHHRASDTTGPIMPTPVSFYTDQSICAGHPPDNLQHYSGQFVDPWFGINASWSQLNGAFDDLFDYGMSDVFRDPATWEFLQIGHQTTFGGHYAEE
ncbi:hypothetical protein FDECE_11247 [Fusarium decemcellulare]|nr:hypothetical protein FDECE_11247 [Fusarium decemcellulare]